jgi:hypothetical protein
MFRALEGVARSAGARLGTSVPARESVVRLAQGQVWTHKLPRGSELSVTCLTGRVWTTREGDARDHFLRVDDTYTSREPGLVCAQALAPSQLLIVSK